MLDLADHGTARSVRAGFQHRGNRLFRARHDCFDRAVPSVANPTGKSMQLRLTLSPSAKADALHAAMNDDVFRPVHEEVPWVEG